MSIICYRCKERPRGSRCMRYCHPCERAYRASRREAVSAKNRKYYLKRRATDLAHREAQIEWWISLTPDELDRIKRQHREAGQELPLDYRLAMTRVRKQRERSELERLGSLPGRLGKAAVRWRKACLSGSRPADSLREKSWLE